MTVDLYNIPECTFQIWLHKRLHEEGQKAWPCDLGDVCGDRKGNLKSIYTRKNGLKQEATGVWQKMDAF